MIKKSFHSGLFGDFHPIRFLLTLITHTDIHYTINRIQTPFGK